MLFRSASVSWARRWPVVLLVLPALVLLVSPGCHHRRSALRPVYAVPAAPPCSSGNCGSVVGAPPAGVAPAVVTPGFEDGGAPSTLEAVPAPSAEIGPRPGPAEEPPLRSLEPSSSTVPSAQPQLQGPSATRNPSRRPP